MTKFPVYNINGEKVSDVELNPDIFGVAVKPQLVQHAIVIQQANARQVLAHTKNRGEVAGGGRKPWRQKGTGRARHGSTRSPIWVGGGITFGPRNERNFSRKINAQAKRKALFMGLSDKAAAGNIIFLDTLALDQAKTKQFYTILQKLQLRSSAKKKSAADKKTAEAQTAVNGKNAPSLLVVLPKKDEKVYRASRNINRVTTLLANSLNIVDVVKHRKLVMPVDALAEIEKTFLTVKAKKPTVAKPVTKKSVTKKPVTKKKK